jgi:hypothetical protein
MVLHVLGQDRGRGASPPAVRSCRDGYLLLNNYYGEVNICKTEKTGTGTAVDRCDADRWLAHAGEDEEASREAGQGKGCHPLEGDPLGSRKVSPEGGRRRVMDLNLSPIGKGSVRCEDGRSAKGALYYH